MPTVCRTPSASSRGHRDAGLTACPGNLLYAKLPTIRAAVKKLMGAAIFAPRTSTFVVDKGSTTPVTLTAKAMNAQKWQLLVADASGHTCAHDLGLGRRRQGHHRVRWNEHTSTGSRVRPGVYTLTLSSWTSAAAAVPYIVNVSVDADPDVYSKALDGSTASAAGTRLRPRSRHVAVRRRGCRGQGTHALRRSSPSTTPAPSWTRVPTATRMRVRAAGRTKSVSGAPDVRVKAATGLVVSDGTRRPQAAQQDRHCSRHGVASTAGRQGTDRASTASMARRLGR